MHFTYYLIMERSIGAMFLFLVFLHTQTIKISLCSADSIFICPDIEREALLSFKQALKGPKSWLSSWSGEECCRWRGVGCDNRTRHVVKLDLRHPYQYLPGSTESTAYMNSLLGGEISPSLLELKHLNYLDLSVKAFGGIGIPEFLGSLQNLRYLNLSNAGFGGTVPYQLGNLTKLRYLDLSSNTIFFSYGDADLNVNNLQWLSGLSLLQRLDMSRVDFGKASNWLQVINMLSSLSELRLSSCGLHDDIPPLPYVNSTSLAIIDLSGNNFNSSIPKWLFSLRNLVSLELSSNDFQGPIPDPLQNLTALRVLDLSRNNFTSVIPDWLYDFSNLELLYLTGNNLQGTISNAVGNLTLLTTLDLLGNDLVGEIPRNLGNLCNLRYLDLSSNKLTGKISGFLESSSGCILNSLEWLGLADNQLSGHLPHQLGQLKSLDGLFLNFNSFSGPIPMSIGGLSSLRLLHVANNRLNGTIPESLGRLSKLEALYISFNSLEGVVSEVHFANLTRLKTLSATSNSLTLKVNSNWVPPFQLKNILLGSWKLGPQFPTWLQTQKGFSELELSNTEISDTIPTWFWNLSSQFSYLNLSQNQVHGELPSLLQTDAFYPIIILGSNHFKGPIPHFSSNVGELDLSNNSFSGSISHLICDPKDEPNSLEVLDLSENLLSGELPDCWMNWPSLKVINLRNNNLTGSIPSSMGSLLELRSLHLRNNNLSGLLPSSLQNCSQLMVIGLGNNRFSGRIPMWMGENLSKLMVLGLRSNNFTGSIPIEFCHLTSLQVLDLSHNNLTGTIPRCFNNFSSMATKRNSTERISNPSFGGDFVEEALLVMKGIDLEYSNNLILLASIDLSINSFFGNIPEELTSLLGLTALNLSSNRLTGKIPEKIGNMVLLESLDLSINQLSGVIPQSMSSLTFLSYMNFSYNNLSGNIPSSTQFQRSSAFSFIGNQELCGLPLPKNCTGVGDSIPTDDSMFEKDDNGFHMTSFFVSMAVGFVLGFWGVCGCLIFKRSWRYAYFRFLEDVISKCY